MLVVASTPQAAVDDLDVMIAGCKALKQASKREQCLEAALRMSKGAERGEPPPAATVTEPKSDEELQRERVASQRRKFELVERAATALRAATEVGVSYREYGPLVQQFATEVALLGKGTPSPQERSALDLYEQAIIAYQDAGKFWNASVEFFARRDNVIAYPGGLPLELTRMGWVADKYGIATQKADIWGLNRGIQQSYGLTRIWAEAQRLIDEADQTLIAAVK